MRRAFPFALVSCAFISNAQLIVDTVVGGAIPSGVPAQSVAIRANGSFTRDLAGNPVFGATGYVIQRVRDGIIETIAGTGESGFSGDGGPAVHAKLTGPTFTRYDSAGNLYFADGFRIRRIDPKGIITTVIGTGIQGALGDDGPATSAQVDTIYGLDVDAVGNVYFAEPARIRRLAPDGQRTVIANIGGGRITRDPSGNLYIFQGQSGENVYRVTPDGSTKLFAGYAFAGNSTLHRLDTAAVGADSAGNIYALQQDPTFSGYKIWRISPEGQFSSYLNPSTSDIQIGAISAMAIGGDGTVYFVGGNRLQSFIPGSPIQLITGGTSTLPPDGIPARQSSPFSPETIAVSRTGDLYIKQACSVLKVDSTGVLRTYSPLSLCVSSPMAVDTHGRVFVIGNDPDSPGTTIVVTLGPDGQSSVIPGSGLFVFGPGVSLGADSKDRLYILSPFYGLRRWSDGSGFETLDWYKTTGNTSLLAPYMSIDASDNVYLENVAGQIYRFTPDGNGSLVLSLPPNGPFPVSRAFAADPSGRVWTSVLTPLSGGFTQGGLGIATSSRVIEVLPCCGYSGDGGPAVSSRLNGSTSAISASGEIFVVDGLGRIRKVSGKVPDARPAIYPGGIVNSASGQGGAVSPGELVSIYGTNFGGDSVRIYTPDNNFVPTSLGSVAVFFNGQRGAILSMAPGLVNAFVPYGVAGLQNVSIMVMVDGAVSDAVTLPVTKTAFGLFTSNASGSGQAIIRNEDVSLNSSSHPATAGSYVTLIGTGEGVTSPALPDGALVISTPYSMPANPVAVTIDGHQAEVLYAGAAPSLPTGVFVIIIRIPAGVPAGDVPVVVSTGGVVSTQRVTCAVK